MENSRIRFEFHSVVLFIISASLRLFTHEFIMWKFPNVRIFRYWYSSLHMAAQHQPTSREPLNLSIFYSNDNFIVSLLCSCVRDFFIFFLLILGHSSSVQQLNTKKRLSQKRNANFKHGASEHLSMWWRKEPLFSRVQCTVIVFLILHGWEENCAINYIKF